MREAGGGMCISEMDITVWWVGIEKAIL